MLTNDDQRFNVFFFVLKFIRQKQNRFNFVTTFRYLYINSLNKASKILFLFAWRFRRQF